MVLNIQTDEHDNGATRSRISDLFLEDIKWPHHATEHQRSISGYRRRSNDCNDHVSKSALMMKAWFGQLIPYY